MPTKFPFIIAIKRIYIASKEYKHDGENFPNEIITTGKKEAEFTYLLCMIQICRLFVSLLFSTKDVSFAVTTNMNVFSVSVSNSVVVFKGSKAFPRNFSGVSSSFLRSKNRTFCLNFLPLIQNVSCVCVWFVYTYQKLSVLCCAIKLIPHRHYKNRVKRFFLPSRNNTVFLIIVCFIPSLGASASSCLSDS